MYKYKGDDIDELIIKQFKEPIIPNVVEVTRCKDCEYYDEKRRMCKGLPMEPMLQRNPDDYCSRGKRK